MVIFIDSGFFVSLLNEDDDNHKRANLLFDEIVSGKYGIRLTTDFILDESVTVTWVRTRRKKLVEEVYSLFMGKEALVLLHSFPHDLIIQAWEIFEKYSDKKRPLSYTDCTNIAFCKERNIKNILSFDSEFDGILTRIS